MIQKYIPNDYQKAIFANGNGFCFGNAIFKVEKWGYSNLNRRDYGFCVSTKFAHYDIEDVYVSLSKNYHFTCAELEVYKVLYS